MKIIIICFCTVLCFLFLNLLLSLFFIIVFFQSTFDDLVLFLWSSLSKKFCLKFSRVSFRTSLYNFLLNNQECRVSVIAYVEFATCPWYHAHYQREMQCQGQAPLHWKIVYIVQTHQIRCTASSLGNSYQENRQRCCHVSSSHCIGKSCPSSTYLVRHTCSKQTPVRLLS